MKSNIPVAEAIDEEGVLPERVQEALGVKVSLARQSDQPGIGISQA